MHSITFQPDQIQNGRHMAIIDFTMSNICLT